MIFLNVSRQYLRRCLKLASFCVICLGVTSPALSDVYTSSGTIANDDPECNLADTYRSTGFVLALTRTGLAETNNSFDIMFDLSANDQTLPISNGCAYNFTVGSNDSGFTPSLTNAVVNGTQVTATVELNLDDGYWDLIPYGTTRNINLSIIVEGEAAVTTL